MNITFLKPSIMDGKKMKKGSSLEVDERRGKKMIDRGFAEITTEKPVEEPVEVEIEDGEE